MAEKTATSSSSGSSEKPEAQRTEELIQYSGPHDPADYEVPAIKTSEDEVYYLRTQIQTSENAQQMFLDGKIDEDMLARAVAMFGKPSNPSEVLNRPDAAYAKKLPKWIFSPPEGLGLTLEQRIEEANKAEEERKDAPAKETVPTFNKEKANG